MGSMLLPKLESMSAIERSEALMRVAMKTPEHLKQWLDGTGRRWLVLNGLDLVDALPWPHGIEILMQIIAGYRDHRATIPTGRFQPGAALATTGFVQVPVMKGETLEIEELDRAIRALISQAEEKDPTWKLSNIPL